MITRLIKRNGKNRVYEWPAANVPIEDVIDRLWVMALDVAMDDGDAYETLRQAIGYLERQRNA